MVCCMLLNQTTRVQVDKVRDRLFSIYPDPESMSNADESELSEIIRCLGFYNKRARSLKRMSSEWKEKNWKNPISLHGLGKYAQDSWDIFVKGTLPNSVTDHVLTKYLEWRKN